MLWVRSAEGSGCKGSNTRDLEDPLNIVEPPSPSLHSRPPKLLTSSHPIPVEDYRGDEASGAVTKRVVSAGVRSAAADAVPAAVVGQRDRRSVSALCILTTGAGADPRHQRDGGHVHDYGGGGHVLHAWPP